MAGPLTEQLDNLYTTTWQNMKSEVGDNIFDATPFWFWLRQNGGLEKVEGGRFMTEPLRYAKADVVYVSKGESLALSDKEFLTIAKDDWKYQAANIIRFGVDDQQNRGKNAIVSLMNAKLENARDSLVDDLETTLAGLNRVANPKKFLGLQDIVADVPTASAATLHGIDPSVDTWWRNQTKDMAGISTAASLVNEMNKMLNACSNNIRLDAPDILITGKHPFEIYWQQTLSQRRVTNQKLGDAGFQNIEFRGVPMVWAPAIASSDIQATAARMYFLVSKFFKFKYDPMVFFDMTEWKAIPSQINDRVAQIITAGNLMTSRRRVHGVMFNINTL
jgi:hypothetical protein